MEENTKYYKQTPLFHKLATNIKHRFDRWVGLLIGRSISWLGAYYFRIFCCTFTHSQNLIHDCVYVRTWKSLSNVMVCRRSESWVSSLKAGSSDLRALSVLSSRCMKNAVISSMGVCHQLDLPWARMKPIMKYEIIESYMLAALSQLLARDLKYAIPCTAGSIMARLYLL